MVSGLLKLIGQFSLDGLDGTACKTREKFVNSHWSVPANFDPSVYHDCRLYPYYI